jgi:hypothetical protein
MDKLNIADLKNIIRKYNLENPKKKLIGWSTLKKVKII